MDLESADISVYDTKLAPGRTLVDLCQGKLKTAIERIPDKYLNMELPELREEAKPGKSAYLYRMNFWRDFQEVTNPGNQREYIQTSHIYRHGHKRIFYQILEQKPALLAFIVRPIKDYEEELNQMLLVATDRLWELINMPIHKYQYLKKGQPPEKLMDVKAAEIILKTIQMLENRTKGLAVQRIAQKTQVEHTHVESIQAENPKELDAKIEQLQGQLKELPGETIDVSSEQKTTS